MSLVAPPPQHSNSGLSVYWPKLGLGSFEQMNRKTLDRVASAFRCEHDKRVLDHLEQAREGTRVTLAMLFIVYACIQRAPDGLEGVLGDLSKYRDTRVTRDHDLSAFVGYMYHDRSPSDFSRQMRNLMVRRLRALQIVMKDEHGDRDWDFADTAEIVNYVHERRMGGILKAAKEIENEEAERDNSKNAAPNAEPGEPISNDSDEDDDGRLTERGHDDSNADDGEAGRGLNLTAGEVMPREKRSASPVFPGHPFNDPLRVIHLHSHADLADRLEQRRGQHGVWITEDGRVLATYIDRAMRLFMVDEEDEENEEGRELFAHVQRQMHVFVDR